MALRFCPGGTLDDYVKKHHPLSQKTKLCIARDISAGLAYLESEQITHRDLKPDNVLVRVFHSLRFVCAVVEADFLFQLDGPHQEGQFGWAKISDFGLSKQDVASSLSSRRSGARIWMAEEVIRAENLRLLAEDEETLASIPRYESSADIWSFGLVLLFICTGKHHTALLEFEKGVAKMLQVPKAQFPRPVVPEGLLAPFDSIINECLDPDPKRRPKSEDLRKRFQAALEALSEPSRVQAEQREANTVSTASNQEEVLRAAGYNPVPLPGTT